MAITSFKLGPAKGLRYAQLDSVPNILVIVGPNGAGKSTLLDLLWKRVSGVEFEGGTRPFYIGPDRLWRKTSLNSASLVGMPFRFRDLLEQSTVPGFQYAQPQGYVHTGLPRGGGNADDTQALVKFAIVRLEMRRKELIAQRFEDADEVLIKGNVPDIFAPLRHLIATLLPHLRFFRVDTSQANDQKVLFEKLDLPDKSFIDIDDLSSGERAVVGMFLQFVEAQVDRLLQDNAGSASTMPPKPVVIIDEPELHLHPALQSKLMTYVRQLAEEGEAQFIVATHSPTIMDSLAADELYLLASPAAVGDGNQLSRITSSAEQLEVVRELTGSTYAVTRGRPIVFVEGEKPGAKVTSDKRLIEMLIPEAMGWVLVPGGGRCQTIEAATNLREPSLTELPGIPVFALVDHDQGITDKPDYVITWPVCMVENLLLDVDALWSILAPHKEKLGIQSRNSIAEIFTQYINERCADETRLRLLGTISPFQARISLETPEDVSTLVPRSIKAAEDYLEKMGGGQRLVTALAAAESEVNQIITSGQGLERFHGKNLLKRFYEEYAKRAGYGYPAFCYQLASAVTQGTRLRSLIDIPSRKIRQFTPEALPRLIGQARDELHARSISSTADITYGAITNARQAWELGREDPQDRQELRKNVLAVARTLKENGDVELHDRILRELVQLGTA